MKSKDTVNEDAIAKLPLAEIAQKVDLLIVESEFYAAYIGAYIWALGGKRARIQVLNADTSVESFWSQLKDFSALIEGWQERAILIGFGSYQREDVFGLLRELHSRNVQLLSVLTETSCQEWGAGIRGIRSGDIPSWFWGPVYTNANGAPPSVLLGDLLQNLHAHPGLEGYDVGVLLLNMALREGIKTDPVTHYLACGRGPSFRELMVKRIKSLAHKNLAPQEEMLKYLTASEFFERSIRVGDLPCAIVEAKRPSYGWPCSTLYLPVVRELMPVYGIRALAITGLLLIEAMKIASIWDWYHCFYGHGCRRDRSDIIVLDPVWGDSPEFARLALTWTQPPNVEMHGLEYKSHVITLPRGETAEQSDRTVKLLGKIGDALAPLEKRRSEDQGS